MMNTWISLEEKMPEKNTGVLVTDGENVWSAQWFELGGKPYWTCHGYSGYDFEDDFGKPIKWMPLPKV